MLMFLLSQWLLHLSKLATLSCRNQIYIKVTLSIFKLCNHDDLKNQFRMNELRSINYVMLSALLAMDTFRSRLHNFLLLVIKGINLENVILALITLTAKLFLNCSHAIPMQRKLSYHRIVS